MKKIALLLSFFIGFSSMAQVNHKKINKLRKKYYTQKFRNGYAVIQHNRKRLYGLINKEGEVTIKPQYLFLKGVSKCNSLLASNQPLYGPDDGGGRFVKGFKDILLINPENKLIKNLGEIKIIHVQGRDKTGDFKNIFNFVNSSGQMGLIDDCGRILVPAQYLHINRFNEKGQAVVFKKNSIQVINSRGEKLLPEPLPYEVNPMDFISIPTPGEVTRLYVIDNKILSVNKGRYGIVDIKNNRLMVPYEYEKISPLLTIHQNDTIGYRAKKNGKETFLDIHTGKEKLPLIFTFIKNWGIEGDKRYVTGWLKDSSGKEKLNVYDLKKKKMLFPRDFSIDEAKFMNNDNWIIRFTSENYPIQNSNNLEKNLGIYNTKEGRFVLKPGISGKFDLSKINNRFAVFYDKKNRKGGIFDAHKQQSFTMFDYKPEIKSIQGGEFYRLTFRITKRLPKGYISTTFLYSYYSKDFKPLMENIKEKASFHYENHKLFLYPDIYREKILKVYNIDGELIQEKLIR